MLQHYRLTLTLLFLPVRQVAEAGRLQAYAFLFMIFFSSRVSKIKKKSC
jgi:hypothetical protein